MNLVWAGVVVVGVAAVAVTAMLLVRRSAPAGSYFEDGDRAAGVFGVLATGFAVLIGFVVFNAHPWALTEDRAQPFFQQAVELGVTFWDTANQYQLGTSEEIVGRAITRYSRREEIVLATRVRGMHDGPGGEGLSRKAILEQVDASLTRLGTDYIQQRQGRSSFRFSVRRARYRCGAEARRIARRQHGPDRPGMGPAQSARLGADRRGHEGAPPP